MFSTGFTPTAIYIYIYQIEGFERILQVPGRNDCTGLGHVKNIVSVVVVFVVARLGAGDSNGFIIM